MSVRLAPWGYWSYQQLRSQYSGGVYEGIGAAGGWVVNNMAKSKIAWVI
jgi:hypothetical protein